MSRIPKEDGPTYRRTVVRRRSDPEASAPEAPPAPAPEGPAAAAASAASAAAASAAAASAAAAPDATTPAPQRHAAQRPAPQRPAPQRPAPQRPATAPAPSPAPRAVLDAEALAAELAALAPGELARLMGAAGRALDLQPGDEVTGQVVRMTHDTIFVDVGAKAEAWLPRAELAGREPAPGDSLTAWVLDAGSQGIRLAASLSGSAAHDALASALDAGVPVEGRVESRNTGGFVVAIGTARAFCPISHIDRHPGESEELDAWIGRTMPFRVLELRGRDVLVSHRVIQDEQAAAEAERIWAEARPGDALEGVVTGTQEYGVFVDVGGVTGLLHRQELDWQEQEEPMPPRGTRLTVHVLEIDHARKRLSLTMRGGGAPRRGPQPRPGRDGGKEPGRDGGREPRRDSGSLGTFADLLGGLDLGRKR